MSASAGDVKRFPGPHMAAARLEIELPRAANLALRTANLSSISFGVSTARTVIAEAHQLVVAEHREEPRLLDEPSRGQGVGTAIDQVAHRKQPVPLTIEAEPRQFGLQQRPVTVQVADDEVAAPDIPWKTQTTSDAGERDNSVTSLSGEKAR